LKGSLDCLLPARDLSLVSDLLVLQSTTISITYTTSKRIVTTKQRTVNEMATRIKDRKIAHLIVVDEKRQKTSEWNNNNNNSIK